MSECNETPSQPNPQVTPQATLQNKPFPPYRVANKVASIELKAKNGYVHTLRVACDGSDTPSSKNALPLLKRLWPFWVSKGGRYKKAYKTINREGRSSYNVPLHVFWMSLVYNTVDFPHKPKCKTHDWLDWADGNIFIESNEVQSQRVFEEQSLFHSRFIRNFEAAACSWDKNPDSFCASTFRLIPGEKFCSC